MNQLPTDAGLVPQARAGSCSTHATHRGSEATERGQDTDFEGGQEWAQLGFRIQVVAPGQRGVYHGERGQEDFLVVSGECVLVIEGEERRLKAWDFVHCPPWTKHIFVGAGEAPCVIVMVGSRMSALRGRLRGRARLQRGTMRACSRRRRGPDEAYARWGQRNGTYGEGWLPS